MRSLLPLSWSEFKLFWRDAQMVFWTLAFPMALVVVFAEIYRAAAGAPGAVQYLTHFMPGLLALSAACVPFFSIGVTVAQYRDLSIYRRLRTCPVSPLHLAASHIFPALVLTVLAGVLVTAIAGLVYECLPEGPLPGLLLAVVISYLAFSSLAFALASIMRTGGAANSAAVALLMPMMLLSGVLFPHSALSEGLRSVSGVLPLTHAVNIVRIAWHGSGSLADANLLWLGGWMTLGLVVSRLWFRWE